MRVDWKYDLLFTFQLFPEGGAEPLFAVIPTTDCVQTLRRYGLIFKPLSPGAAIIAEKRFQPDGSKATLRPIRSLTSFSFILQLKEAALLNQVAPYVMRNGSGEIIPVELPSFSGRSRILYFNNLSASGQIDSDLEFIPPPEDVDFDLSSRKLSIQDMVSADDLASLAPNVFSLTEDPARVSLLQLQSIRPDGDTMLTEPITAQKRRVEVDVPSGAYRLIRTGPGGGEERIYAGSQLLGGAVFGLIEIFKDDSINYGSVINYQIEFEKI